MVQVPVRDTSWKNWLLGVIFPVLGVCVGYIVRQVIVNTDRITKLEVKLDEHQAEQDRRIDKLEFDCGQLVKNRRTPTP